MKCRLKDCHVHYMFGLNLIEIESEEQFNAIRNAMLNTNVKEDELSIAKYQPNCVFIMYYLDTTYYGFRIHNTCDWNRVNFTDVFEIIKDYPKFKTEDELIEYAIKNKLRVHTKTFEEYCCLMMLYERNGACYITGIKPTNNIEYCWNIYAENNYNILHSREKMYRGDVTFLKNHEEDAVIDFETFYEMLE